MLRNKLMTACSVAVLTAALYGCSSSSDDGANMQVQDLQDQIAALNAELGEGEELTPEALAALIQAKADAEAALADAMIATRQLLQQRPWMRKLPRRRLLQQRPTAEAHDCPARQLLQQRPWRRKLPRRRLLQQRPWRRMTAHGSSCSSGHGGGYCPGARQALAAAAMDADCPRGGSS